MGLYIATKKKRPTLILPKTDLTNYGTCRKCGQPYSWKVSFLRQFSKPQTEQEDTWTRVACLFTEYKSKEIGPCCAEKEHRQFIALNAGMVIYD